MIDYIWVIMIDLYQANINSSEDPGYIHPEVARLQHLLHQREIQQRDFMEAFTGKHHIHVHVIPFRCREYAWKSLKVTRL